MKKTFRKAIAVLLAVLMVAFSVPFSAFAANTVQNAGPATGWWGDNNWRGWENPNIPQGEQDYSGWNDPDTFDSGYAWADAVAPETDSGQGADALKMLSNYKPVLTITVSDQGTADNRIWRKYYGYKTSSTFFDYQTVKDAGNILNPADLKAGQRIAVTFEIGGFDMLYSGQLKGTIDMSKLAYGYYPSNPSSSDKWKQCSEAQTTQAFITRGYSYYGDAATDGGSQVTDNVTGQFYCPFSSNTAVPSSAYVGKDTRPLGDNGMIICTLSLEVLQDCNLAECIDFTKDNDNNPPVGITSFECYDPDEVGSKRYRFTMDTTDELYTAGLIAVNYNDYDASGAGTECTHANVTATPAKDATCTEAGNSAYWTCNDCGKMFSDEACTTEITEVPTIPATGHSLEETAAKDATCTEAGNSAYWTCSVCGKMFADASGATEITEVPTISATGHSLSEVKEVPSTCTVKGTAAYWRCTACGKMFSNAEGTTEISVPVELPLADHNYNMVKTDATCTEASSEVYTCSVCGDTYTTHVDPAKGHTAESANNAVAPTCTKDGKEADTVCSVCGITLTTGKTIPATGHTEVEIPAVDATCTEAGSTAGTKCSVCGEIIVAPTPVKALGHKPVSADNAVAPTFDAPGKEADTVCSVCGETLKEGAVIPALKGVNITVKATDLGTTAINGEDATNGATVKVLKNSKVALTAAPVEGAEFVGWALNGKIVSSDATYSPVALTDVTYEAVFTETAAAEFTVVFVDNYGNVISAQTVADASKIIAPTAPTRPGYTFKGWSVDYTTLTTGATIYAQFEKDAAATYTVTATGCTITTAAGVTATDVMTDVAYDTSVTITANSGTAASWKIGDSTVAFGESYTFYVGSDVTVVPQFDSAVVAVPTVSNVKVSEITTDDGIKKAVFLATRSMTDDCKLVANGFIYGKNLADINITLDDVDNSTVKRVQNATNAEQFSLTYSLKAQTGTMVARAYLVYVDAEGVTQTIYADPQTYTYA